MTYVTHYLNFKYFQEENVVMLNMIIVKKKNKNTYHLPGKGEVLIYLCTVHDKTLVCCSVFGFY